MMRNHGGKSRGFYSLVTTALILLIASQSQQVHARSSSFLPSHGWGVAAPSLAPVQAPSSSSKKSKKTKKHRTPLQDDSDVTTSKKIEEATSAQKKTKKLKQKKQHEKQSSTAFVAGERPERKSAHHTKKTEKKKQKTRTLDAESFGLPVVAEDVKKSHAVARKAGKKAKKSKKKKDLTVDIQDQTPRTEKKETAILPKSLKSKKAKRKNKSRTSAEPDALIVNNNVPQKAKHTELDSPRPMKKKSKKRKGEKKSTETPTQDNAQVERSKGKKKFTKKKKSKKNYPTSDDTVKTKLASIKYTPSVAADETISPGDLAKKMDPSTIEVEEEITTPVTIEVVEESMPAPVADGDHEMKPSDAEEKNFVAATEEETVVLDAVEENSSEAVVEIQEVIASTQELASGDEKEETDTRLEPSTVEVSQEEAVEKPSPVIEEAELAVDVSVGELDEPNDIKSVQTDALISSTLASDVDEQVEEEMDDEKALLQEEPVSEIPAKEEETDSVEETVETTVVPHTSETNIEVASQESIAAEEDTKLAESPTEETESEEAETKNSVPANEGGEKSSDVSETNDESMDEYEPSLLEHHMQESAISATVSPEVLTLETNSVQDANLCDDVTSKEGEKEDKLEDDPYLEKDVLGFIGKVLDEDIEDVRAWATEDTSSSNPDSEKTSTASPGSNQTNTLSESRGGFQRAGDEHRGESSVENSNSSATQPHNVEEESAGAEDGNDDDDEGASKDATGSEVESVTDVSAGKDANEDVNASADSLDENHEDTASPVRGNGVPEAEENEDETPTSQKEAGGDEEEASESSRDLKTTAEAAKRPLDRSALESSEDKDTDAIVSVVTWNLAEESPSEEDAAFIRKFRKSGISRGSGSDLVLVSGQECENIKPRRSEGSRSREFRRLTIKMLGKEYVPIALHLLGGIQFGLFAKRSFLKEIEDVSIADVTCGIGNVFHNKGAIAAFVQIKARNSSTGDSSEKPRSKSLRMMFVTAHMAAHVKNSDARDSDFWRISNELETQAPEGFLSRRTSEPQGADTNSFLFDSVDRVFFCGDLNYRVDLPRELTEYTVLHGIGDKSSSDEEKSRLELMRHDQLIRTLAERRAFPGFAEGKITFAPTFKFDKETGDYDTSHKQRIPAWTDRILFKPAGTRVLEYTSVANAQHSDHRPVHGTFRVNMDGRELPPTKKRRSKRTKQGSGFDII
jgi:hypothetical protein